MAQADFEFAQQFSGTGSPATLGGADGQQLTHSSLSNPLAGEGTLGREYRIAASDDSHGAGTVGVLGASVQAGAFVGVPNTHAISLRAWCRARNGTNTFFTPGGSGLIAKSDKTFRASDLNKPIGYLYYIYAETQTIVYLRFKAMSAAGEFVFDITSAFAHDLWRKLRMDVIPTYNGPTFDRDTIKLYTGTGATGSEIWTLESTITILSVDTYFSPWGGSRQMGYYTTCSHLFSSPGQHAFGWTDRVQCFVKQVV